MQFPMATVKKNALYTPIWYVHLVCMFKLTFNLKNCLFRLYVPFVNLVVEKV
jgi:hypothetical protein